MENNVNSLATRTIRKTYLYNNNNYYLSIGTTLPKEHLLQNQNPMEYVLMYSLPSTET